MEGRRGQVSKTYEKLWETSACPLHLSPSHFLPCPPLTLDALLSLVAKAYKAAIWLGTGFLHMMADGSQNWDPFQLPLYPGLSFLQCFRRMHHRGFKSTINQSWGTQDAN